MDDAEAMGVRETVGDVARPRQRFGNRQRSAREPGGQRLALHELEHQIVDTPVRPDVVNGADVGMIECRDGARLHLEPLAA